MSLLQTRHINTQLCIASVQYDEFNNIDILSVFSQVLNLVAFFFQMRHHFTTLHEYMFQMTMLLNL